MFLLPFLAGIDRERLDAGIPDGWRGQGYPRFQLADAMTELPAERRHFRRLPVQIPVVLRGTDTAGRDFFDRAEVVSIDERGARVHTRFLLNVGAEATIELSGEKTLKRMRVVWRGEADGFYAGMIGLEFVDAEGAWSLESLRASWGARNY